MSQNKLLLFLCSGNYYRSRFAEHLFNHLASGRDLDWRAESRGIGVLEGPWRTGPISVHALKGMRDRGIPGPAEHREPRACLEDDLRMADLVIAVKEAEHRALMLEKFADWCHRIEYWHIHDLDCATPAEALPELEQHVRTLVDRLACR